MARYFFKQFTQQGNNLRYGISYLINKNFTRRLYVLKFLVYAWFDSEKYRRNPESRRGIYNTSAIPLKINIDLYGF